MAAGLHSLGVVTVATPGTPVNALADAQAASRDSGQETTSPVQDTRVHSIRVQSWLGNAGAVYVGRSADMNRTTGADVLAYLAAAGDVVTFVVDRAPNGLSLADIWIDADNADDDVLVSYIRA